MKNHSREFILSGVAIILLGLFIFFSLRSRNELEQFTTSKDEEVYYYVDDSLFEYKGKLVLDRNNKVTELSTNNGKWEDIMEPIYYKNEKKVLFPNAMSLVRPTLGLKQNRLNYFTQVSKTDTYIKLSNIDLDMNISNAFMYDGMNTYFFIDPITIEYGDQKMELSPLSYVRSRYRDYLYIYDYDSNKMTAITENIDYDVKAYNDDYEINLSTGNILYGGQSVILMKNIDRLTLLTNSNK